MNWIKVEWNHRWLWTREECTHVKFTTRGTIDTKLNHSCASNVEQMKDKVALDGQLDELENHLVQ